MKVTEKYHNHNENSGHPDANDLAQYAEYLRNETDQVPQELIDHVASCAYCRAEVMAITDLLDALPDVVEEPIPDSISAPSPGSGRIRSNGYRILRTAAAVAAMFLLAWIIQQLVTDRPMHEPIAADQNSDSTLLKSTDSTNTNLIANTVTTSGSSSGKSANEAIVIQDTQLYASAFVPNPLLETLVGAKYRSGIDPAVIGPDADLPYEKGDTLKISWKPDPQDDYKLVILDNKNILVQEIPLNDEDHLNWKIDLRPGLYYWKFFGKDELWKVGRLKVVK
jgi:hypothetical protein